MRIFMRKKEKLEAEIQVLTQKIRGLELQLGDILWNFETYRKRIVSQIDELVAKARKKMAQLQKITPPPAPKNPLTPSSGPTPQAK